MLSWYVQKYSKHRHFGSSGSILVIMPCMTMLTDIIIPRLETLFVTVTGLQKSNLIDVYGVPRGEHPLVDTLPDSFNFELTAT